MHTDICMEAHVKYMHKLYIGMHKHTCVQTGICTQRHICTCSYIRKPNIYMHIRHTMHMHIHKHKHIYSDAQISTYTYTQKLTYIYTHIYTRSLLAY